MTNLTHLDLYKSGITSLAESLGRLKGLLHLYGIGTTRIPEMQEGKDSEDFLVGLVQRWPSLGYLGIHQGSRFHFYVRKTMLGHPKRLYSLFIDQRVSKDKCSSIRRYCILFMSSLAGAKSRERKHSTTSRSFPTKRD